MIYVEDYLHEGCYRCAEAAREGVAQTRALGSSGCRSEVRDTDGTQHWALISRAKHGRPSATKIETYRGVDIIWSNESKYHTHGLGLYGDYDAYDFKSAADARLWIDHWL